MFWRVPYNFHNSNEIPNVMDSYSDKLFNEIIEVDNSCATDNSDHNDTDHERSFKRKRCEKTKREQYNKIRSFTEGNLILICCCKQTRKKFDIY